VCFLKESITFVTQWKEACLPAGRQSVYSDADYFVGYQLPVYRTGRLVMTKGKV